jgi:isocitrate dehydrogenase (NAD+)
MFEAVHGSAPDIAGQGVANPTAFLLAACLLLDHMDRSDVANRIRKALESVVRGEVKTRDMGGEASTAEYTNTIIRTLEADPD